MDAGWCPGPTFDCEGRRVAISEGNGWWWLPEPADDPETPSPGGTFRRGRVVVIDVDSGSIAHVDVYGDVEEGWKPTHETWEAFALLGRPHFSSSNEIVLTPEFGGPHHVRLSSYPSV